RLAVEQGVPPSAIVLEEAARSTIENFACSRPVLARLGVRTALLVTDPWHMPRSLLLARRHGMALEPSPARVARWEGRRHAGYFLFRDAAALIVELCRQPFVAPGVCRAVRCEGCRDFDSPS